MTKYEHAEAFCLMRYASRDRTEDEMIWNSRDGATPFVISLKSGKEATHVDWRSDIRCPDYVPTVGSRIFIDMTPERCKKLYREKFGKYWAKSPLTGFVDMSDIAKSARAEWSSVESMATSLMMGSWREGAPELIEVTEDWLKENRNG